MGYKAFVINIAPFDSPNKNQIDIIYYSYGVEIFALVVNEIPTSTSIKYSNFIYIFYSKLAFELFEHTRMNNHIIEFIKK